MEYSFYIYPSLKLHYIWKQFRRCYLNPFQIDIDFKYLQNVI